MNDVDLLAVIESDYPFVNPAYEDVPVEGLEDDIFYIGYLATISAKEERVRPLHSYVSDS